MNRASLRSAQRRSRRRVRVARGHSLSDPGPQPPRECPPAYGTQPPRQHPLRPAAHPTAHSWTRPPPSSRYQGATSAPVVRERVHRAAIRRQEPMTTGKRPPVSIFLGWPTGVVGGHDLNLMLTGPATVPEAVPVVKLSRPPLIIAPSRRAKEPIQVHRVHRDGLLTPKLLLHAIHMVKLDVHEKNKGNRRQPCLDLAHVINPTGFYVSPLG
ncbi:hypothetical protein PIB30_050330 [Stylosanthes scabra]|uniref:Uncharacterized protein n=1 Tax=Stylosanthes scabra TaxID=79078 RepID=A0ABU6TI13_9FABA|nr:hypothetical protein [Stylosanthes scabra]